MCAAAPGRYVCAQLPRCECGGRGWGGGGGRGCAHLVSHLQDISLQVVACLGKGALRVVPLLQRAQHALGGLKGGKGGEM